MRGYEVAQRPFQHDFWRVACMIHPGRAKVRDSDTMKQLKRERKKIR